MATKKGNGKAAANAALQEIVTFAQQQKILEDRILKGEQLLKELTEQHRRISQEDLPSAMAEAGLKEFTLESGETVEIKEDFSVGIPKERQDEAYAWLKKNNLEGIIKTEVSVRFGKGEVAAAVKLAQSLVKQKLAPQLDRSIHWQTLKAFVIERTRAAKPVPPDLFGVHQLNKAVIKLPKP